MKLIVNNNGLRLDKYLAMNTDYSREFVSKMIDNGFVLVDDTVQKGSYKLKEGQVIDLDESYHIDTEINPVKMDLNIVYEDDDLMVINKPSGLVVHPGSGNYNNTLLNGLMYYTSHLSDLNGKARAGIVHRIDKDTSGLMVVAKSNKAHELLAEGFKIHAIKRTYYALLEGVLPYDKATIDAPIKRDPNNFNKMGVFEDGKEAITHLEVVKRYKHYTLVKLNLETGRTHQIRVHMAYIGFPIYNDPVYNKKASTDFGQFLHSKEIDFVHPITGRQLHFECELPEEFQKFLDSLS